MKTKNFIAISLSVLTILFTVLSCIKDEALNREADIISFSLPDDITLGVIVREAENIIRVTVRKGADVTKLAPVIELSEGATVSPASGVPHNFTNNVTYTVTSEDGNWSRQYTVEVTDNITLHFTFEDWTYSGNKYYKLADDTWDSGNGGIALINPSVYPTRPTEDSYEGKYAAMLETQKGAYIEFISKNIPIFSGSLFRGKFNIGNALIDPLTAPQFGQPHPVEGGKPVALTGFYKYKLGSPFIGSDGKEIQGRSDSCTIRAVLFKVTKGQGKNEYLTAKDVMMSDKIVGWADMEDCSQQLEYTEFIIPFVYRDVIDYDKYDYKLAVIFASSKNGDNYEGAVGSTLIIDDVRIVCDPFDD
ncbi:MAG: PCMD domain-containing protein [Prevotellaceae bacterium]|jgi:hypothetical protein|nr:PCMD domain-containing protein [Prevotellaceae bacterium]